jgi:hypothetical protein
MSIAFVVNKIILFDPPLPHPIGRRLDADSAWNA